jgi:hypothetical protein
MNARKSLLQLEIFVAFGPIVALLAFLAFTELFSIVLMLKKAASGAPSSSWHVLQIGSFVAVGSCGIATYKLVHMCLRTVNGQPHALDWAFYLAIPGLTLSILVGLLIDSWFGRPSIMFVVSLLMPMLASIQFAWMQRNLRHGMPAATTSSAGGA